MISGVTPRFGVRKAKVQLPSFPQATPSLQPCLSPVVAGETRSKRVSSSPSWLSVCILSFLYHVPLTHHPQGASGTGRTTFVNTLCESEVLAHKISDDPETAHLEEGIRIKPVNVGA